MDNPKTPLDTLIEEMRKAANERDSLSKHCEDLEQQLRETQIKRSAIDTRLRELRNIMDAHIYENKDIVQAKLSGEYKSSKPGYFRTVGENGDEPITTVSHGQIRLATNIAKLGKI